MAFFDRGTSAKLAALGQSQAIIEFDLGGTILDANANFLAVVGLRARRGSSDATMASRRRAGAEHAGLRRVLGGPEPGEFRSGEFRRIGKGGREVWIQGSYNPVLGRGASPCG